MFLRRRRSPEKRKHVAGLLRAFAYLSGVGLVCGALSIRAARAEVADQTLVVGRQMVALANTTNTDVTKVTLNGQPMFVGSALSQEPVSNVLDRFEKHCKANGGQTAESWRELATKAENADVQNKEFFKAGLIRAGADNEGTVVCFVKSAESKPTVMEAFKAFGETGELGAIGQMRYVYAKKTEKGNTHILTAWTADKFNMKNILPADDDKDVPGSDFADIPRPENAQRVLSSRVDGTPYGVNVYRTDASPEKVAAFYDSTLIKQGWVAIDAELDRLEGMPKQKGLGHLYEKDGVVMTLAAHVDQGKTFATLGLAGVHDGDQAKASITPR